jgi:hypothetical protein
VRAHARLERQIGMQVAQHDTVGNRHGGHVCSRRGSIELRIVDAREVGGEQPGQIDVEAFLPAIREQHRHAQ